MNRIAVIIPAYNEEKSIKSVIDEVNFLNIQDDDVVLDVIVINDCSTDFTSSVVSDLNCILLDLPINLGIGGAVQTGFKYAYQKGYDYVIRLDGDGQHPPKEIPKLIKVILNNNYDVVIGSRFVGSSGFKSSFLRRLGIKYFKFLIKLYCNITITDCTSGFVILNKNALSVVNKYYPDEYPEPESIILFTFNKLKISEVPVIMKERLEGKSSIQSFTTIYYMLKVSLAIFFTFIRIKKK